MTETSNKPKYLAPYTCPRCGSTDHKEWTDGSESVGYRLECGACQTRWTQWLKIDYIPLSVEVDGVEYPLEKEEPTNPGLQAAMKAYLKLRAACEMAAKAALATAQDDSLVMARVVRLQQKVLHDDLQHEIAAADKSVDGYIDAAETESLGEILQDVDQGGGA